MLKKGQKSLFLDGLLSPEMVLQDQGGHGFHHGNGPGAEAGIMPAFGFDGHRFSPRIYRLLSFADGRCGFDGHAKDDILA